MYYYEHYGGHVEAQNARNEKTRHIEPAVIVAGIIGAMLAGAPIVSCQFQTDSLLPAKMLRGRGRGGEAANPAKVCVR